MKIIGNLSTHILHYHDKKGGKITNEQVIHKARFGELAKALSSRLPKMDRERLIEIIKALPEEQQNDILRSCGKFCSHPESDC